MGGTLFSVEEAASFWNTELVWRVVRVPRIAWDGIGLWCDMRLSDMMKGRGGTLFSVEEAASFWNTELVWCVVCGTCGLG